ncbi:hypothetical protein DLM77_18375 [Leptospira yasudae]|uniref:Uncharacterized protein n=1 Tax=Leptospira yasudae TaxID=2202201 RepID=A0ABX9LYP4_9LEPT|nr:hypothetical protein DLM77_18375 [Leptospira yasudae]
MYFAKKFNWVESTPPVKMIVSKKDSKVLQEERNPRQNPASKRKIHRLHRIGLCFERRKSIGQDILFRIFPISKP